jgi:hypothetical protein
LVGALDSSHLPSDWIDLGYQRGRVKKSTPVGDVFKDSSLFPSSWDDTRLNEEIADMYSKFKNDVEWVHRGGQYPSTKKTIIKMNSDGVECTLVVEKLANGELKYVTFYPNLKP